VDETTEAQEDGEWENCWSCMGEGGYHDCWDDTCCCLDPDDRNMPCQECGGKGGWIVPHNAAVTPKPPEACYAELPLVDRPGRDWTAEECAAFPVWAQVCYAVRPFNTGLRSFDRWLLIFGGYGECPNCGRDDGELVKDILRALELLRGKLCPPCGAG